MIHSRKQVHRNINFYMTNSPVIVPPMHCCRAIFDGFSILNQVTSVFNIGKLILFYGHKIVNLKSRPYINFRFKTYCVRIAQICLAVIPAPLLKVLLLL